jgi:guanylate kinase
MLVLSSPSGAGKTTLSRKLLAADPGVELSISVTTRKQRPGEIAGRDYHFIDAARFDAMIANGELLEWAQVFGHHYGTPRAPVEAALVPWARCLVRHRLAGNAAASREGGSRSRQHLCPTAVNYGPRAAAASESAGFR